MHRTTRNTGILQATVICTSRWCILVCSIVFLLKAKSICSSQTPTILGLCKSSHCWWVTWVAQYFYRVDQRILQHMIDSDAEFLMEVTDKTKADVKVRSISKAPWTGCWCVDVSFIGRYSHRVRFFHKTSGNCPGTCRPCWRLQIR